MDGGMPIASDGFVDGGVIGGGVVDGGFIDNGYVDGGYVDNGYVDGGYVDGGYVDGGYGVGESYVDGPYIDGGCADGNCGWTDDGGCYDRGGCPPCQPCWLNGLTDMLYNGEYFAGATGFKNQSFFLPDTQTTVNDCNFGMYGGFNLGLPLCKLTCGLASGQFGMRSVQSNFNGSTFTPENRDQLFITAGLFRRVDYGFQAGVVFDYLHEEWFAESDVAQVRGDLGWVFGSGNTFGFRFTGNVEDDVVNGALNGIEFNNFQTTTNDWYRLYLRRNNCLGGYGEIFAGSADNNYAILGINSDLPLNGCMAVQSGFTYYLSDEVLDGAGRNTDAWNIYVGISFRPRSQGWYNFYERPMMDVADNGSMLIRRQ